MRLALVSNFSPDHRALSEYGFHLAHGLAQSGQGELIVLSGNTPTGSPNGELRVWDYGSPRIPLQVITALRRIKPDGVLFNMHFTSWGGNLANLAGLMAPMLAKRAGFKTITLLHHLPQTIDSQKAGYRLTPLHRLGIELACRALAQSDVVCFTLQKDVDHFRKHYSAPVVLVEHGLLGIPCWSPLPERGNSILTFGNWGRSKNPELLIRVFLEQKVSGRLVVAGGSSHTRKGFMENMAQRYANTESVVFMDYIPEPDIPELFHSAHLLVLPYEENTGVSGVLHQTCQYGRVPVIRDLPVFRRFVAENGLCAYFYSTEEELGGLLEKLLSSKPVLEKEGYANFQAVQHLRMEVVAGRYWDMLAVLCAENQQNLVDMKAR